MTKYVEVEKEPLLKILILLERILDCLINEKSVDVSKEELLRVSKIVFASIEAIKRE